MDWEMSIQIELISDSMILQEESDVRMLKNNNDVTNETKQTCTKAFGYKDTEANGKQCI